MPQEFRYPLTRYCLRGGALTLPRAMVGLFPAGEVTALDTKTETEHSLNVLDERTVTGLGPLFKQHRLAVNDELLIRALEDGRFSLTPVRREHKPDYSSSDAQAHLLDELIAASVPVTEAEVRALYQGIPEDVDLAAVFEADERFVKREGRWHNGLSVAYPLEPAPQAAPAAAASADAASTEAERSLVSQSHGVNTASGAASGAASDSASGTAGTAAGTAAETAALAAAGSGPAHDPASTPPGSSQTGLWQAAGGGAARAPENSSRTPSQTVFERRRPTAGDERSQALGGEHHSGDAAAARGDEGDDEDDGADLEVTELANRLRAVLAPCGFRFEPVARGQILLTADLGRKSYKVLVQLLTRSDRLDWADLLARRRALNVRFLAVAGDHRALLRLTNPAELARATMWSWQALDRLATLQRTMSFSPIELESHFERDGLFEKGLERFEAGVAERVAERGVVSELLTRLAVMRAPTVFLLEDLAGELKLPRDRLLRLLEMLSEAPFQLVAKVDQGEFVLRQRVADSLNNLAGYATSLRERLPTKQVERLTGLAEPDLLTGVEFDEEALDGMGLSDLRSDERGTDDRPLEA